MKRPLIAAMIVAALLLTACTPITTYAHRYATWPQRVCAHHGGVKRVALLKGGVRLVRCKDGHIV